MRKGVVDDFFPIVFGSGAVAFCYYVVIVLVIEENIDMICV